MLARATAREREIAVRLALGASRVAHRAAAARREPAHRGDRRRRRRGARAVAVAGSSSPSCDRHDGASSWTSLDWRVFAFTASLAAATCLLFGLVPAMRATAQAPGAAMKAGSRGTTDSRERFGLRRALVVAQVALSLVLVVGALLFVRSLRNLMTLDAGLYARTAARRQPRLAARRRSRGAPDRALRGHHGPRLRRLPGVSDAAQAFIVPISGSGVEQQHRHRRQEAEGERQLQPRERALLPDDGHAAAGRARFRRARHAPGRQRRRSSPNRSPGYFSNGANPIGRRSRSRRRRASRARCTRSSASPRTRSTATCATTFEPLAFFAAAQEEHPDPLLQVVVRPSRAADPRSPAHWRRDARRGSDHHRPVPDDGVAGEKTRWCASG